MQASDSKYTRSNSNGAVGMLVIQKWMYYYIIMQKTVVNVIARERREFKGCIWHSAAESEVSETVTKYVASFS